MVVKMIILINLLAYAFITAQAMFYLLALGNASKNLRAPAYIELRNLLDSNLMSNLRIVYYVTLVSSIMVCVLTAKQPVSLLFITSVVACIALWIDVLLMMKGNIPLNKFIQTWTPEQYPSNWQEYRTTWFSYYHRRQIACIIGFVSLIVGLCFSN